MDVRGVDFSGAAEPGRDIWLTEARFEAGRLDVRTCRSATEAFGVSDRTPVLQQLRASLADTAGVTGLDFSFGMPAPLLPNEVDDWRGAVEWFADTFADADAPGESTVIEIYPAGTLRRLETVDEQYKDSAHDARGRRDASLTRLESDTVGGIAVTMDEAVRETALSESGGDALD
ncbi:MAG: hypothetical protein ACI80F_002748, partial [Natronomonas sp.]